MKKLIYVRENWHHMDSVSGYDGLFQAISKRDDIELIALDATRVTKAPNLLTKVKKRTGFNGDKKTNAASLPHEKKPRFERLGQLLVDHLKADPNAHGLVASGESHFGLTLSNAEENVRSRLTVCLHQPPAWHRLQAWDSKVFEGLSSIICVSESLTQFIRTIVPKTPAYTCLHGVNIDFFSPPAANKNDSSRCLLFVGLWLRDFECLAASMQHVWATDPNITLDCIIPLDSRAHPALYRLAMDSRVRWHAKLDATALRSLYQNANLLLMPVIDATANNGIVEALACGLPIVSTNIGGMAEYVLPEFGKLAKHSDPLEHASLAMECLNSEDWLKKAAHTARKFADNELNWDSIADHVINNCLQ